MSEPTDKRDDNLNLTDAERKRFAVYCRSEAYSYNGLAEQMEKLPHGEFLAKPLRTKATAYAIVARELESAESQAL